MRILLVPGSSAFVLWFIFYFFSFLALWSCVVFILLYSCFSSFLRLALESCGVSEWITNLVCSLRIVRRRGAGHRWRTQDGDAERIWLCYMLVPKTASATWRVLLCTRYWFACFFLVVLKSHLFTRSIFLFFFQLVLFRCLPHPLRGGGRQFCFFYWCYFFFFLIFWFVFVVFFLLWILSVVYFIACACRIQYNYMFVAYCLAHRCTALAAYVATYIASSLWRICHHRKSHDLDRATLCLFGQKPRSFLSYKRSEESTSAPLDHLCLSSAAPCFRLQVAPLESWKSQLYVN